MVIFIDESGDPGFKTALGSSKFFVITLVIFDDELDAEETALGIKRLKQQLKKSSEFEFKFNKCNKELRLIFLEEIKKYRFSTKSIVVNKSLIYSDNLQGNKSKFYNYFLQLLISKNSALISQGKIRIDGLGEREFRKELQRYLKSMLNTDQKKVVENLKFRDSRKDVLIQMADMIAGTIRRNYESEKSDAKEYFDGISSKIKKADIWEFA